MMALILEQTEMSTIFGSDKCLLNVLNLEEVKGNEGEKPRQLKFLKNFIVFDSPSEKLVSLCNQYGIKLYSYGKLIEEQMQSTSNTTFDHNLTKRDAIFTISYTSGTEKDPKGVMLSNENFISAIANILKVAGDFPFNQEDVYISYLPLAHVFDRLGVYGVMSIGARIGFYGGVILKILDDLQVLQPTVFPSVPRLLNKVYDRIQQGLQQQSMSKQWIFNRGIQVKKYWLENMGAVENFKYDQLVFKKVKARLGGRVRVMITASAPIAGNVLEFLKCAFCCPIVEAYGQTESCGASYSTKIFDNQTGHVGGPALGIESKLRDVPDLNYTRDSKPYPQGEVMLRGPSIFVGYFKNPKLTAETKT